MAREFVAYKGSAFSIEWYYSPAGECQARDYYLALGPQDRRKVMVLFKMMGDVGKISDTTKFRNEGDKVYAFKPQRIVF